MTTSTLCGSYTPHQVTRRQPSSKPNATAVSLASCRNRFRNAGCRCVQVLLNGRRRRDPPDDHWIHVDARPRSAFMTSPGRPRGAGQPDRQADSSGSTSSGGNASAGGPAGACARRSGCGWGGGCVWWVGGGGGPGPRRAQTAAADRGGGGRSRRRGQRGAPPPRRRRLPAERRQVARHLVQHRRFRLLPGQAGRRPAPRRARHVLRGPAETRRQRAAHPAYSHTISHHHPIVAFTDVRVPAANLVLGKEAARRGASWPLCAHGAPRRVGGATAQRIVLGVQVRPSSRVSQNWSTEMFCWMTKPCRLVVIAAASPSPMSALFRLGLVCQLRPLSQEMYTSLRLPETKIVPAGVIDTSPR